MEELKVKVGRQVICEDRKKAYNREKRERVLSR